MPIGAHVQARGGLSTAVTRAQALGAECLQLFLCAPRRWQEPNHSPDELQRFGVLVRESGIGPNFVHAIYLINLASSDPTIHSRSIEALGSCAKWAARCGLAGVVVHLGSGKGQPIEEAERNVVAALRAVLARNGTMRILLENSAGSGNTLGSRFDQIGSLIAALDHDPRIGVCLDTAHAFASGYDVRTAEGLELALDELDLHVGLDRLKVIHANDSKAPLGSAVDRHENIGQGHLGEEAFERMLRHTALASLPWVLEVPGYAKEGPDEQNVRTLKRLAGRLGA
jgi:deoxyribonuclease-4